MSITKRVCVAILGFALPGFLVVYLFGPDIFVILFGPAWREAGHFASIMSIYILSSMIYIALSPVMNVLGNQRDFLFRNIIYFSTVVTIFYSAYLFGWNSELTLKILSTSMFIFYTIGAALFFSLIRQRIGDAANGSTQVT